MTSNKNQTVSRGKSWRPCKKSKHGSSDEEYSRISAIQLPEDLLSAIFILLPVMSLIRFRCISKGICELIDSPDFVKNRNKHLRSKSGTERGGDDYAIILKEVDFGRFLSVKFLNSYLNLGKIVELNFTSLPKEDINVIGCCNGIFCVGNILSQRCVLWNPCNGTFRRVEWSNLFLDGRVTSISIGYDYVRDDFKVICFVGGLVDDDDTITSMEVYSLRKDSWRKFDGNFPSGNIIGSRTGVCVNGAMHWLWTNPTDKSTFIAVFDLLTETFTSLSLPSLRRITILAAGQSEFAPYKLTDFGCRLSITIGGERGVNNYVYGYSVQVMENYGDPTSWTELYYLGDAPNFYYYPNRESRLLYVHLGRLTWWDPKDKSNEKIEFPGRLCDQPKHSEAAYIYERNLVRLDYSISNQS